MSDCADFMLDSLRSRGSGPLLFTWPEKVNSLTAKLREVATLCVSMVIPV